MARVRLVIIVFCVCAALLIGGSLYWQQKQEERFERWPLVTGEIVASDISERSSLLSMIGRPVYTGHVEVLFASGQGEQLRAIAAFEHQSLWSSDTQRLRKRLVPGKRIQIRISPDHKGEAHIPGMRLFATSDITFSVGVLLLLPMALLYAYYRIAAPIQRLRHSAGH